MIKLNGVVVIVQKLFTIIIFCVCARALFVYLLPSIVASLSSTPSNLHLHLCVRVWDFQWKVNAQRFDDGFFHSARLYRQFSFVNVSTKCHEIWPSEHCRFVESVGIGLFCLCWRLLHIAIFFVLLQISVQTVCFITIGSYEFSLCFSNHLHYVSASLSLKYSIVSIQIFVLV